MDAATALAQADQARTRLMSSVTYPRGYVATSAVQAALLMVGFTAAARDVPADWLRVLCGVLLLGSMALIGVNAGRFNRHNGVRIRDLGAAGAAYIAAMSTFAYTLAFVVVTTRVWWLGIAGAPFAGLATVLYLRTWLARYQRGAR